MNGTIFHTPNFMYIPNTAPTHPIPYRNVSENVNNSFVHRPMQAPNMFNNKPNISIRDVSEMLPTYDSTNLTSVSAQQFILKIERLRDIYEIEDRIIMMTLSTKLKGPSLLWYRTVQDKIYTFREFQNAFIKHFGVNNNEVAIHEKLRRYVRPHDKDFMSYYYEMLSIGDQAQISQNSLITYIINGLNEYDLQGPLRSSYIPDLECLRERIQTYVAFKSLTTRNESQRSKSSTIPATKANKIIKWKNNDWNIACYRTYFCCS